MKARKIFSIITVFTLLLSVLAMPANAAIDDKKAVIYVDNATVKLGGEVTVDIKAIAKIANFNFAVKYDATAFDYVADSFKAAKDLTAIELVSSTEGLLKFGRAGEPANLELDDAELASFKLTTKSGALSDSETKKGYDITIEAEKIDVNGDGSLFVDDIFDAAGNGYGYDAGYTNEFKKGTVNVVKTHEAPVVAVKVDGEAVIGKTVTADTTGTTDSWGLIPTWAYQWMVDGTAIEGATDKTYVVKADDFGKKLSVKATATVEADENTTGSATSAETAAVIADAAAKASVANVKLDSDVVAVGAPVMVKYDFTASINGGEDKSEIAWTAEDGSALKGAVSADGKTFTAAIEDLGKKVKVTVTPKGDRDTAKGDAVSFTSEAIVAGNPTATNVKASVSSIRVNKAFTVEYTYSDPDNGGEEAADIYAEDKEKTVVAYTLYKDAGLTEAVDKADYAKYITVEDGKYTASADAKNLYIVFEVTPVNKAGIAGKTAKSEAYKITKKSSSGGDGPTSIIGGKPTTSPGPTTSPDPTKDPNAVTGGKDEIVLVINNKNASVWGEAKTNDVAPIIRKDRTMLPARFVAEALGAEVSWDEAARKVTIVSADKATTIVITIDSDKAMVNDKEVKLDSAAFIENDRTYTPIRFISESLGAKVAWDEAAQKVTITK